MENTTMTTGIQITGIRYTRLSVHTKHAGSRIYVHSTHDDSFNVDDLNLQGRKKVLHAISSHLDMPIKARWQRTGEGLGCKFNMTGYINHPDHPEYADIHVEVRGEDDSKTINYYRGLPTIRSGSFDNLVHETDYVRVWVSRCTVADGIPEDEQVSMEQLRYGVWSITCVSKGQRVARQRFGRLMPTRRARSTH